MKNIIQILDSSGDKKYFTIIPHYIVNHSSHWEQSLYLVMKRVAGEQNTCFASHLTLADLMKCSRPQVCKTIKLLEKRGWIKKTGKVVGKTQSVLEYEIIDLWKFNMDHYQKKESCKPQNTLSCKPQNTLSCKPQNTFGETKLSTIEHLSCKPQNTEEETYIKKKPILRRNIKKKYIKKKIKKKYSSCNDITEDDLVEISQAYKVSLGFVKLQWEKLQNWCKAKGKRYKNYKHALRNWVLMDLQRQIERRQNDSKRGVDARHVI